MKVTIRDVAREAGISAATMIAGPARNHDASERLRGYRAALAAGGAPIAAYMSPPPSTVQVAIAEVGSRAVERLLEAIEKKIQHVRRHEALPTRLMIRASCGAPRRR